MHEVIAKIYEPNNIDDMLQYPKNHITPPLSKKFAATHTLRPRPHYKCYINRVYDLM